MCLTAEALLIFLNLLPPEIVDRAPDRILVHAEERTAVWTLVSETPKQKWCTDAKKIDAAFRLKGGVDA
ncbi:hypothetical protein ATO6_09470 [Oceanicola sp. 22II-s10i]|uniref:hypothetical protein n=1 Tax=Oceanicola sp. 22II-s10i TaxID=1317116 RepID=UPI000B523725|nr:hypothetical protein [Oceanicola sp. 22II-s10i]OWU85244.1 hypothetical protein ATO6_09470 [Oceanicola sp. 22II-s10i]